MLSGCRRCAPTLWPRRRRLCRSSREVELVLVLLARLVGGLALAVVVVAHRLVAVGAVIGAG
eukprot:7189688-Prymnesium_polylepis.1